MSLNKLFPNYEIKKDEDSSYNAFWCYLLSIELNQIGREVIALTGISNETLKNVLSSTKDVAVLVPKRKKDKRNPKMRKLALLFSNFCMTFSAPLPDLLNNSSYYPIQYQDIIRKIGIVKFTQFSGTLLWPHLIPQVSQRLLSVANRNNEIVVFFDHHTGDYDCWLDGDFNDVWTYNHETNSFDYFSGGGFAGWFEKRMLTEIKSIKKIS